MRLTGKGLHLQPPLGIQKVTHVGLCAGGSRTSEKLEWQDRFSAHFFPCNYIEAIGLKSHFAKVGGAKSLSKSSVPAVSRLLMCAPVHEGVSAASGLLGNQARARGLLGVGTQGTPTKNLVCGFSLFSFYFYFLFSIFSLYFSGLTTFCILISSTSNLRGSTSGLHWLFTG